MEVHRLADGRELVLRHLLHHLLQARSVGIAPAGELQVDLVADVTQLGIGAQKPGDEGIHLGFLGGTEIGSEPASHRVEAYGHRLTGPFRLGDGDMSWR